MYFAASFKSLSTGLIDISADGQQIDVVDHSNYRDYTGTAIAGGASSITLPTDASPYDDYYNGMEIEILAGTSAGDKRIITNYVASTRVITVGVAWSSAVDNTSVFEIGEPGHLTSYFTDFRKVKIALPNGDEYLLSSIGDGDASTTPAATSTLPITDTYDYTTGDGLYTFTLYTVPTWDSLVAYAELRNVYVYYGGSIYQLLQNDTGTTPGTDATIWALVADIDDLPSKYRSEVKMAVTCDTTNCYRNHVNASNAALNCNQCNSEIWMRNVSVQKAFKLKMILDAVPILMYQGLYDDVITTINNGKRLCCCGS